MKTNITALFLAVIAIAAIVYFGRSSESTASATPHTVVAATDSTINWDSMEFDAKKGYMKQVVFPQMKALFQSFDATKYADFKCKTCHGEGVAAGTYKMPNPRLPKLPNSKAGWDELKDKHADMMKFMMMTVKPQMAKLLGKPQMTRDNPKGFGCGNCHTDQE
jgi:hypothetical protein